MEFTDDNSRCDEVDYEWRNLEHGYACKRFFLVEHMLREVLLHTQFPEVLEDELSSCSSFISS